MTNKQSTYFPEAYQCWLFQALELVPGEETDPEILEFLFKLNRQWVHSDEVMDYDTEDGLMRAYSLYYMTINMPKLWFVMDHSLFNNKGVETVTEFGCGPGTFLWAYLFYLAATDPTALADVKRVCGIDRSPAALHYAGTFADVLKSQPQFAHIEFEFIESDWLVELNRSTDLAIFGNVMNEGLPESVNFSDTSFTSMLVIEPGTRKVFHPLLEVRQAVVSAGYKLQFPCPSQDLPCPMHDSAENWCHFSINRFSLPFIQRISNKAGRLNPRHNFCGFLFSKGESSTGKQDWRCLSKVKKVKRSGIRWLCNGCEVKEIILNRHARSDANRPFLDAEWGDILRIEPELTGSRLSAKHTAAT